MTRQDRWISLAGVIALLAMFAVALSASYKPTQVAQDQISPKGSWRHGIIVGYAGLDTTIALPFKTTLVTAQASAACSLAFSQNPALVSFTANFGLGDPRKVIAAAVDTFLAGHPNAGEARLDTLYIPLNASESLDFDLEASMLKVKVASGTPTMRWQAFSNRAF